MARMGRVVIASRCVVLAASGVLAACSAPAAAPDAPDARVDAPLSWPRCDGDPRATSETLAQKAAAYDARVLGLHVHPQMPWVLDVTVAAGVDPEAATVSDVVAWRSSENDGLWSALVLAAEAYRFAATHDPAARTALATLLHGEQLRMQITGVPGLFVRQLIPPGITGLACPTDDASYAPSPDKTTNVWVHATGAFAGWCFKDNVSQDEYVGHIFALGAVARLVDDPELRAIAVDLLRQIGHHLVDHHMQFVDWDGRPTQWGKVYPQAGTDSPGYLAVLGASFLGTAANATGDADLAAAYAQLGYTAYLDQIAVWSDCASNWNDLSMLAASFHDVIASDAANRATWQQGFHDALVPQPLGILRERNAWYDLLWAESTPEPAIDPAVIGDAVCALREFPRSNHVVARAPTAPAACAGRHAEPMAATPLSIADRCATTFAWWGNPYELRTCDADATQIDQPGAYLLPYWMGRYRGFITADE
jgi:hypothetical protein